MILAIEGRARKLGDKQSNVTEALPSLSFPKAGRAVAMRCNAKPLLTLACYAEAFRICVAAFSFQLLLLFATANQDTQRG
jgi:hypothetical protein